MEQFFWFFLRTSCVYNIWHIFYRYCIRVVRVLWSQLTFWLSILAWRKPWLVTAVFVVFAQMSRLQWGHTRIHDRPSLAYKKLNINSEAWRRLDFWLRFNIYIYTWTTNQPVYSARFGFLVLSKISDRLGRFNSFLQRLSPFTAAMPYLARIGTLPAASCKGPMPFG